MSSRTKQQQPVARRRGGATRQQAGGPKNRLGWRVLAGGLAVVAVAVAALIALQVATSGDDAGSELADKINASGASLPQQQGFAIGSADAPLKMQVYEDFQCKFCVEFTANVEPVLLDEYVATGKLRMEYRNFPILGNESAAAAEAAVCAAEQNRAWNYILALFSMQAREGQASTPKLNVGRLDRDGLLEAARMALLERGSFQACLDEGAATETVVAQHTEGTAAGVAGTPSFVLNGQLVTNVPGDEGGWRALLDGALASGQ